MTYTAKKNPEPQTVAVIGGGAAGMMAAIKASEEGAQVLLFEKNETLGKKLRITGKGRCNLTNNCERDEFLSNVPTNPRFLYPAISGFSPQDTMRFFEGLGIPLKTERGKRVFPQSDRAQDIVDALAKACRVPNILLLHERVIGILTENGRASSVKTVNGTYRADAVILCTGGVSYPGTGSTGDGYEFAKELGHTVIQPAPSLVPLVEQGRFCAEMQGLSLRNIAFRIVRTDNGKTIYEDFGELLFTHFGLSGPVVLSASAHLSDMKPGKYEAQIDLKPALDEKKLDTRLLSDFAKYKNRDFSNALGDLLPQKMIAPLIARSEIDPSKKVHSITREERERLVRLLKCLRVPLFGFRSIEEAIVTRGGVNVKEVNPSSMESKLISGLYFAGEVLDLDAYTGGFNLQIAFSTAVLAGTHAAKSAAIST